MCRKYAANTEVLFVMVTVEEKEAVKRAAKWKSISMNELVRRGAKLFIAQVDKTRERALAGNTNERDG